MLFILGFKIFRQKGDIPPRFPNHVVGYPILLK
jgi:hypothetical protein